MATWNGITREDKHMESNGKRIDGRAIARRIQEELTNKARENDVHVLFSLIMVGEDPVTENFVRYKMRFGEKVGITPILFRFSSSLSQEEFISQIGSIGERSDALIVQLPLPQHIDTDFVLSQIPSEKDVDVLSQEALSRFVEGKGFFPPVTKAILHALKAKGISLKGKSIVLYGYGKLVGKPFSLYLEREGIPFSVIRSTTNDEEKRTFLKGADIIVSGIGIPGILKGEEIKEGVVVIDAGTSESGGSVVGDLHPDAYEKTSFYTPVPGGIGPLTIASLFENVWEAWKRNSE